MAPNCYYSASDLSHLATTLLCSRGTKLKPSHARLSSRSQDSELACCPKYFGAQCDIIFRLPPNEKREVPLGLGGLNHQLARKCGALGTYASSYSFQNLQPC